MQNARRALQKAVDRILASEAIVVERRRRIRESVQKRAAWDHRLKGKGKEELDVIAAMENLRDTRTLEDIADQGWEHQRANTFALFLIVNQLDELLRELKGE